MILFSSSVKSFVSSYQYESERFDANVEIPQIVVEDVKENAGETAEVNRQFQRKIPLIVRHDLMMDLQTAVTFSKLCRCLEFFHQPK